MVKIRLRRTGRKKQPIVPHRRRRLAEPARRPVHRDRSASTRLVRARTALNLKSDRANYWLDNGAQPTDTVRSLLRRAGVLKARHESARRGASARSPARDRRSKRVRRGVTRRRDARELDHRRARPQGARHSRRRRRRADHRRAGRGLRGRPSCFRRHRSRRPGAGRAASCTSRASSPFKGGLHRALRRRSPTATSPSAGAIGICSCRRASSTPLGGGRGLRARAAGHARRARVGRGASGR